MVSKEIQNAVNDILLARIDKDNYGMLGKYRMSFDSHKIVKRENIVIPTEMYGVREIRRNGEIIGTVEFRFSSTKRNGMYKMLNPKFVWS